MTIEEIEAHIDQLNTLVQLQDFINECKVALTELERSNG